MREVRIPLTRVPLAGAGHYVNEWPLLPAKPVTWVAPAAFAETSGRVHEIFGPPDVHDLGNSSQSTPIPGDSGHPFGLTVDEIRSAPFRLQLAGYVGEPGNYRVAFTSPEQPGIILVGIGHHFEELGLRLTGFGLGKNPAATLAGEPGPGFCAWATLHDEQTDREVMLDSDAYTYTEEPLAVCRLEGARAKCFALREGETFPDRAAFYRIERIQIAPPEVVVTKHEPGLSRPDVRILHPAENDSGSAIDDTIATGRRPVPAGASLATNNN